MTDLLSAIEVHLGFDCTPYWAGQQDGRASPVRASNVVRPAPRLNRFGTNLANAYLALSSKTSEWGETLSWARLALGPMLEGISTPADAAGGRIGLAVKFKNLTEPVPAACLSDGQLASLAIIAGVRLAQETSSLFVLDEPETHLHPQLLIRMLDFLERLSDRCPVVLATHSDSLLDGLRRPADSALVCELDDRGRTELCRLDRERLELWLKDYRGLGQLRGAGFLGHVVGDSVAS